MPPTWTGRVGPLDRGREVGHVVDLVVAPDERGLLLGEHVRDDLEGLAEPFGALGERPPGQAGPEVFLLHRTTTQAELEATG